MQHHGLTRYSLVILIALAILLAAGAIHGFELGHHPGHGNSLTFDDPSNDFYTGPPVR